MSTQLFRPILSSAERALIVIASFVFMMSFVHMLYGQAADVVPQSNLADDLPRRPKLTFDAAMRFAALEKRIQELKKLAVEHDLGEPILLAEEVYAIRLKYQGLNAGWTDVDGKPVE